MSFFSAINSLLGRAVTPKASPVTPTDPVEDGTALGCALIRRFEGYRARPYLDGAGVWTVGFGSILIAGHPVGPQTPPLTIEQAESLMIAEARPKASAIREMLKVPVRSYEFAALLSFSYNMGAGALAGSTLLARLNAGDRAGAAQHFLDWVMLHDPHTHALVRSQGLVNRRTLERDVFLGKTSP